MRRWLLLFALLLPLLSAAAPAPTQLRVVDLRWIEGQPELETWLGCLQGVLNRQEGEIPVLLIRNAADAAWADGLTHCYGLRRETMTPGALLAATKDKLTGQVRYSSAQPWTRNVALTAAGALPGAVIATETDLGLPTVLDLRDKFDNRRDAYAWAQAQYGNALNPKMLALASEKGHLLADTIVAQKLLAVDLSPLDNRDANQFAAILRRYSNDTRVLGDAGGGAQANNVYFKLQSLLREGGQTLVSLRDTSNLSCYARFPVTRPLVQGRNEAMVTAGLPLLTLIYTGGSTPLDSGNSLDYASDALIRLVTDPSFRGLPVGVDVPPTLAELAPALYEVLLTDQRNTAAEFIGAAGTEQLPKAAAAFDLQGATLPLTGNPDDDQASVKRLLGANVHGAFILQPANLDRPGFTTVPAAGCVRSVAELRALLPRLKGPYNAVYLDASSIAPGTLAALLPEISHNFQLVTPSQLFRTKVEISMLEAYLQAQNSRNPQRGRKLLKVDVPTGPEKVPSAAETIPITVRIQGPVPVLCARLIYTAPNGRIGAVDLTPQGAVWAATLPPMLCGGTLSVVARAVDAQGLGAVISEALKIDIPRVDTDKDGLDDTFEQYLGSDPNKFDTDGDGLPDGLDPNPTQPDREVGGFLPQIVPPADGPLLSDAGASTADAQGRTVPAGSAVVYRIPMDGMPASGCTLRLLTTGAGTVSVNGGAGIKLATQPASGAFTDIPVPTPGGANAALTVRITAGQAPVCVKLLDLTTNPEGPYLHAVMLNPFAPQAGLPTGIRVISYDPAGVKSVRIRYGTSLKSQATVDLKPVDGTLNTVFDGELPGQQDGKTLLYTIEATDNNGNASSWPYTAVPIGRTRKQTVALIGARDLQGDWMSAPIWGGVGRQLGAGRGSDTGIFRSRPGHYTVWLLASPRERGITVNIERPALVTTTREPKLTATVPARGADGWYKLGTFDTVDLERLNITITPDGATGWCAYGTLILTLDEQFSPPLPNSAVDWANSITLLGIDNGQEVRGIIPLSVRLTGNIDAVTITADMVHANEQYDTATHTLPVQPDGKYKLNTAELLPGIYRVTAKGLRLVKVNGVLSNDALVETSVLVTVK